MPRYFFDVYDGDHQFLDKVGEELPDRHAAWKEATLSAGESIRDLDGKIKPGQGWLMEVRDESGRKLYTLRLMAEVE